VNPIRREQTRDTWGNLYMQRVKVSPGKLDKKTEAGKNTFAAIRCYLAEITAFSMEGIELT